MAYRFPHLPFVVPPVVGVLGGSFNPAHNGHIYISREALKRLGIRQVWWMVSPQNPLKSKVDMAEFDTRLTHAAVWAKDMESIVATDIEQQLNSRYTVDTLTKLKKRFPRTRFVWLMGADNLASIHHWDRWTEIFKLCHILVMDRAPMSHSALRAKAAIRFKKQRINEHRLLHLSQKSPPGWGFAHIRRHPENATEIRKLLGKNAFLGHNKSRE